MTIKGCNCSSCRKRRQEQEKEQFEIQVDKLKSDEKLKCSSCINKIMRDYSEVKRPQEENKKLKKKNEQLEAEIKRLRTVNGCKYLSGYCVEKDKSRKFEAENAKLKKDRVEVLERLAEWHESLATQYRSIVAIHRGETKPIAEIIENLRRTT